MMYLLKTRNYTTCYDNSFYDITNNQNRFSPKNTWKYYDIKLW